MFNIVLVAPEIAPNTGTIGRLCVCTDAVLHLVEPLGFSLDESRVRRAGLDYWPWVHLHVHASWQAFLDAAGDARMAFLSTRGCRSIYEWPFADGDYLVFGNESRGLPPDFHDRYRGQMYAIPMPGRHARSHNLANAVSIVLYEGLRQRLGWPGGGCEPPQVPALRARSHLQTLPVPAAVSNRPEPQEPPV